MADKVFYILAINFGSTSTKIGLYENRSEKKRIQVDHPRPEISGYNSAAEQKTMRKTTVFDFLKTTEFRLGDLSAIAARAGATPPSGPGPIALIRQWWIGLSITRLPTIQPICAR